MQHTHDKCSYCGEPECYGSCLADEAGANADRERALAPDHITITLTYPGEEYPPGIGEHVMLMHPRGFRNRYLPHG